MRIVARTQQSKIPSWIWLALAIFVSALLVLLAAYLVTGKPADTTTPAPAPSSSYALPQDLRVEPTSPADHERAKQIMLEHPEHFSWTCRDYPPANDVMPDDLIPVANVVTAIVFDETTKQYRIDGKMNNPLIKVTLTNRTEPANSDGPARQVTDVTWSYAGNAKHYGVYGQYEAISGMRYRSIDSFTKQGNHSVTLSPANGKSNPSLWLIATDPTTCEGSNTLSYEWWFPLLQSGLVVPEVR